MKVILEATQNIYKVNNKRRIITIIWIIFMMFIFSLGIFFSFFQSDKVIQEFTEKHFKNIQNIFKDNNSSWFRLCTVLNSKIIFFILFILGYNCWTIYKSTIILYGFIFSCFISSVLQVIFPRNYYHSQKDSIKHTTINNICFLTSQLTFPCLPSVLSCYIYPTFVAFFLDKSELHFLIKFFLSLLSYLLSIGFNILLIAVNIYSLKEIIFGMSIGLSIHILISYIIQFKFNSSKNFAKLIKTNILFFVFIVFGLFSFFIFFFALRYLEGNISEIEKNYKNNCELYQYKSFLWETFLNGCIIISVITIIALIKYEYLQIFQGNNEEYDKAFFTEPNASESSIIDEKYIDSFLIEPEEQNKQWNQTNFFSYIMRVIGFLLFLIIVFVVDYILNQKIQVNQIQDNVKLLNILYKCSIVYDVIIIDNLLIVFFYYLGKKIILKCGLGNS